MLNRRLTAVAIGAMAFAVPALASDADVPTATITYSDLNLNTEEGQAKLESRIASAARKMCEVDAQRTGTRMKSRSSQRCLANAEKSAKSQVAAIVEDAQRGG